MILSIPDDILHLAIPLLLVVLPTTTVAADHSSGYHWARTTQSFNLGVIKSIDNSGENDWQNNWDWALDEWSRSEKFDLVSIPGDNDQNTRKKCEQTAGYIRVCNADYGKTSWAGKAQWSYWYGEDHTEGHIFSCSVRLNDFESANSEEQKLLCHEIGHCLGLDHTSEDGSSDGTCMDYSNGDDASRGPSNNDFDVLEDIYEHTDKYDTSKLVEPIRDDSNHPAGDTSPTLAPIDLITPAPVFSSTPAATDAPMGVAGPGVSLSNPQCSEYDEKNNCKKGDRCSWDKSKDQCYEKDNVVEEDATSQCSDYNKDKNCKKDSRCQWDKNFRECVGTGIANPQQQDVVVSTNQELVVEGDDSDCSKMDDEDTCKEQKACKWKKDECINKNRRLQEACNDYDSVEFDVPELAAVIACDEYSITFELVQGNFATRYYIVLANHVRRQHRLRGTA